MFALSPSPTLHPCLLLHSHPVFPYDKEDDYDMGFRKLLKPRELLIRDLQKTQFEVFKGRKMPGIPDYPEYTDKKGGPYVVLLSYVSSQ